MDGDSTNLDFEAFAALQSSSSGFLDDKQAGHLRRIRDLANQLPDDWSGMMGRTSIQEDFGALRFQLAYMAYALALTHAHRLPAAPKYFHKTFDQLIIKMLSPDVWTYWRHVSTGNGPYNQALGELPAQWDPVAADNIMYSAYVQSMALLFHYMFNDSKYAEQGALTFSLRPIFWGGGDKNFSYDEKSLNEHLYWLMVEKGYLGIACEPNCVFQICNQIPILGFRFHDLVYGGDTAGEVTQGYLRAWAEFGVTDASSHYNIVVQEHEHMLVKRPPLAWADFWMGSFMHAWNPKAAEANYAAQVQGWLKTGPDGSLWVAPSIPPVGYLRELTSAQDFGWAAVCASEMGDENTLEGLLTYADRYLNPIQNGQAYFYGRRDRWFDEHDRLAAMDPHTGNALLAFARLNVPSGLQKLYEGPWESDHFSQPALIDHPDELDIRQAAYHSAAKVLELAFMATQGPPIEAALRIRNVFGRGNWTLLLNGVEAGSLQGREEIGWSRLSLRREGDDLHILCPIEALTKVKIEWSSSELG